MNDETQRQNDEEEVLEPEPETGTSENEPEPEKVKPPFLLTQAEIDAQALAMSQCLDTELAYLLERRERLAFRSQNKLNRIPPMCGVFTKERITKDYVELIHLNLVGYNFWYSLNEFYDEDEGVVDADGNPCGVATTNNISLRKSVKARNIKRRLTFLVDVDSVGRKDGQEANDAERKGAEIVARDVVKFLREKYGFPEPQVVMSGNGYHLLWDIDIVVSDETDVLLKNALSILAVKFDRPDTVRIPVEGCH